MMVLWAQIKLDLRNQSLQDALELNKKLNFLIMVRLSALPERDLVLSIVEISLRARWHFQDDQAQEETRQQEEEELRALENNPHIDADASDKQSSGQSQSEITDSVYVSAKPSSSGHLTTPNRESDSSFCREDAAEKMR